MLPSYIFYKELSNEQVRQHFDSHIMSMNQVDQDYLFHDDNDGEYQYELSLFIDAYYNENDNETYTLKD